jgi:hypothetical protein
MNIRLYHPSDLPILKQLMVEVFDGVSMDQAMERAFGTIDGGDWKWHKARQLDVDVGRQTATIFVAEVDGTIIGFITTSQDQEAGIGHIPNLSIAQEFQGCGMGPARIGLLYQSVGFREIARKIHFAGDLGDMEGS